MQNTRQREALTIHQQIVALREEMAWYLAEQEATAQKEGIDQQITSLEDYLEYVKRHYEDLFKYPEHLIAEMRRILEQTDDEIIAWLKENHEEYRQSSERTQEDMVRTWQKTLDDMRGSIKTYWDEVESIIEQGDEAIIKFLMENSADYRAAGALQAQAYLDEWQRRLDALKAAALSTYQQIQSYNYATTQTGTYGGSGGGSSGGSSGGGGSSTKYKFVVAGKTYGPYSSIAAAEAAKQAEIKKIKDSNPGNSSSIIGEGIKAFQLAQITKYKKGGLVNYTGLAMVHGTEKEPEAFLSAEQTKLFAGLAKSLQAAARIQVAKPQGVAAPVLSGDDIRVTFGDVNVSVEKLESNADYDAMAEKVMQTFAANTIH